MSVCVLPDVEFFGRDGPVYSAGILHELRLKPTKIDV